MILFDHNYDNFLCFHHNSFHYRKVIVLVASRFRPSDDQKQCHLFNQERMTWRSPLDLLCRSQTITTLPKYRIFNKRQMSFKNLIL